jgi:hypothetical protein
MWLAIVLILATPLVQNVRNILDHHKKELSFRTLHIGAQTVKHFFLKPILSENKLHCMK